MKLISVYEGVWVNWSVSSEWSARAIQIRPTGPRHDRTAARQWQQEAVPPLSLVLTGLRESVSPLSLFLFLTARFLPSALIRLPSRRSLVDAADGVSRTATSWTFVSSDRDQERISFLFSFLSFFFFFFFFFYKNKIIFGNFIDMLRQVENFLFNDGLFIIEHGFFLPNKV